MTYLLNSVQTFIVCLRETLSAKKRNARVALTILAWTIILITIFNIGAVHFV